MQIPLGTSQWAFWSFYKKKTALCGIRLVAVGVRIFGVLDARVLRTSLEALVQRHASLRTTFVELNGVPCQRIAEEAECSLNLVDLGEMPSAVALDAARRLAREFINEEVDLSVGPLFSSTLYRLSEGDHVLVCALEHMISDGVSLRIIHEELWTLYDQSVRGMPHLLEPLAIQYGDYAIWQDKTYCKWQEERAAYWCQHLADASQLKLPAGSDVNVVGSSHTRLQSSFGEDLTRKLRGLARTQGALVPLTVFSVYAAAVSRWCDQENVTIGFVSSARNFSELRNVVGFVAAPFVLCMRISNEAAFVDVLKRTSREFYSVLNHGDLYYLPRFLSEQKLFNITEFAFNYINWSRFDEWPGSLVYGPNSERTISIERFPLGALPAKFAVWFEEASAEIGIAVDYDSNVLSQGIVERFIANLRLFAEAFVRDPVAPICRYR